jgi:integrase
MATPFKHPKTGIYYFRRAIPADLQAAFGGRKELKYSLHTKNLEEARRLYPAHLARSEEEFATLRRAARARTAKDLRAMVRAFLDQRNRFSAESGAPRPTRQVQTDYGAFQMEAVDLSELPPDVRQKLEEARRNAKDEPWSARFARSLTLFENAAAAVPNLSSVSTWDIGMELEDGEQIAEGSPALTISRKLGIEGLDDPGGRHMLRQELLHGLPQGQKLTAVETLQRLRAARNYRPIERTIHQVAELKGLTAVAGSELFYDLGDAILAGLLEDLGTPETLAIADIAPPVPAPVRHLGQLGAVPQPTPGMSTSLRDILRSWTDSSDAAANTKIEWSSTVDLFERIIGVVPIESITIGHMIEFRNILKTLPRMRGLLGNKADYVKLGQDTPPGKRVAPATVNKRIVAIKSLLNFAETEKDCTLNIQLNKVHGLRRSRSPGRLPFTVEEVAKILMHPVSAALPRISPETQLSTKWLLLLGAYTGARLREMTQLEISDIFTTEGVTCLAVTYVSDEDDEQDGDSDRRQDKSVKTGPSIRNIPLHDDLIGAGFGEFFTRRKRKGWTYLFEDLDAYRGNRAKNSSRRLERFPTHLNLLGFPRA